MIRRARLLMNIKPQLNLNGLLRFRNHYFSSKEEISIDPIFESKQEEKNSRRLFRDTYLNTNLDSLLESLSRDYYSLDIDQNFKLLKIILNKLEVEANLSIHKSEIDKNKEFKLLTTLFLENSQNLKNDNKYLLGLFPYIMKSKEIFFIKYDFSYLSKLFLKYVEESHEQMDKNDLILCLSLYGYFRPNISPEYFLQNRLFELELLGFNTLLISMKRILNWETSYLNKFKFHYYFTEIFSKLALKETYHNISLSFNVISELDNKLIMDNYRTNLFTIYQELNKRIEEIDEQSTINVLRSVNNCKYIDFTEYLLNIDEIVLKYVSDKSNDETNLINYLLKYLHYLSFIDSNLLKKMKNISFYFDLIKPKINEKLNINHLCSLNLIMDKTDIIDKDLLTKEFNYLQNKIFIKNPDESRISSLKLIEKVLGKKYLEIIETNTNKFYLLKFQENKNIFKMTNNFIKFCSMIIEKDVVNLYLNEILSALENENKNIKLLCNFLCDYVNIYKPEFHPILQEKFQQILIKSISSNKQLISKINEEKKCELIIYLNEMNSKINCVHINPIINKFLNQVYLLKKYLLINVNKNVSTNYLKFFLFLQKQLIEDKRYIEAHHNLEDIFLTLVYYIKYKSLKEHDIQIIKDILQTVNNFSKKFMIKDLKFSFIQLIRINSLFEKYDLSNQFLTNLIDSRLENLKEIEFITSEIKEEIIINVILSQNINQRTKEKLFTEICSEDNKIKLVRTLSNCDLKKLSKEFEIKNLSEEKTSEEVKIIKRIVRDILIIHETNLFKYL